MDPAPNPPSDLTAQSKALALQFCTHLHRREFDKLSTLLDSTATWFVLGRPDRIPWGGTQLASEQIKNARAMFSQFDSFAFNVTGVTAEGERVAVEAVSEGRGPGPNDLYCNVYVLQFVLARGKIVSVREFLDNAEVQRFLENRE